MDNSPDLIKAIWVSHAVILLVQYLARRFTSLPKKSGGIGIYILLLPIGFNLFGANFSPLFIASGAMLGLGVILLSLRLVPGENHEQPSATCSVPPRPRQTTLQMKPTLYCLESYGPLSLFLGQEDSMSIIDIGVNSLYAGITHSAWEAKQ